MDALIIYALSIYMVYHVLGCADILAKPREWVLRTLPGWLTYPLSCPLCFTWWATFTLSILGVIPIGWVILLVPPVINFVLDLVVKALIRMNEPPMMGGGKTLTCGDQSITTWRSPNVVFGVAQTPIIAGQLVHCIPTLPQYNGHLPYGWQMVKDDDSDRWRPKCPALHGRRVRITDGSSWVGQEGVIMEGFRNGDDCSGTWGDLHYHVHRDCEKDKKFINLPAKSCLLLSDDTPFNPLDHEQTK